MSSLCQSVCKFTIVRDEQQALALVVEAAHGIESLAHFGEELHNRGTALRISHCGDVAFRLVEYEVTQPLRPAQQLAVHADVVTGGVGLGAENRDDLYV